MSRSSLEILLVAGAAALLQAIVTLGAFAWLSRALPVAEVGRFGLYLAVVSLALALDGVRPVAVVAACRSDHSREQLAQLAAISMYLGVSVAIAVAVVSRLLLELSWIEIAPLSMTCLILLATSPGLARIEAYGRPHLAVALHSLSWSVALALGSVLAIRTGSSTSAAWAMLAAPFLLFVVLATNDLLEMPSLRGDRRFTRHAFHGIGSHLVTAISGFLDKAAIAIQAGPFALGLYTPLSEFTGRSSALSGMVANLFLNKETRSTAPGASISLRPRPHAPLMDAFFALSACSIVAAAITARPLLEVFVARSSPTEIVAFRLLLASLALNIGAQWSAVTLRARGQFDLYRPYVVSLLVALLLSPWLVSSAGIIGGAAIVLVLRTADIALVARARPMLSVVQTASVAATTVIVLALAVTDAVCFESWP